MVPYFRLYLLCIVLSVGHSVNAQYYYVDTSSLYAHIKICEQGRKGGSWYAYDTNYIYFYAGSTKMSRLGRKVDYSPIPGSDGASFEFLGLGYAKDKLRAYYSGKAIQGSHGASFVHLGNNYAYDKENWYFSGALIDVDYKSFRVHGMSNYGSDKNVAFYMKYSWVISHAFTIKHPESFQYLSGQYAKDEEFLYLQGQPLSTIDPNTAEILNPWDEAGFVRDKNGVYHIDSDHQVSSVTVDASFRVLSTCLPVDSMHTAYVSQKFLTTPLPFSITNERYENLTGVRSCSNYALDSNFVYFCGAGSKLEGADPTSFEDLDYFYAKDANQVYYGGTVMKGVDPKHFKATSPYWAEDDRFIYHWGHKTLITY